jgi:hypothetical protein
MKHTMVHVAISQALFDSQLQTVNMIKNYVGCKDIDHKHVFLSILDDFYNYIKSTKGTLKKKKEPSEFNLFIRDKINEYKVLNPEYNGHELMRKAISAWKLANPKNI